MDSKSLAQVIGIIVLVIVAISAAVIAYAWFSSAQQKSQEKSGEAATRTAAFSSSAIKLVKSESISGGKPKAGEGLKVTIRNIGGVTLDLTKMKVYVNGEESDVSGGWEYTSTTTRCLCVGNGDFCDAREDSANVTLDWDGTLVSAVLYLYQANTDASHSIYVNGQKIADAQVVSGGSNCSAAYEVTYSFDPSILRKGENEIKITNDKGNADDWTATNNKIVVTALTSESTLSPGKTSTFTISSPLRNGYNEIIIDIEGTRLKWNEIV